MTYRTIDGRAPQYELTTGLPIQQQRLELAHCGATENSPLTMSGCLPVVSLLPSPLISDLAAGKPQYPTIAGHGWVTWVDAETGFCWTCNANGSWNVSTGRLV